MVRCWLWGSAAKVDCLLLQCRFVLLLRLLRVVVGHIRSDRRQGRVGTQWGGQWPRGDGGQTGGLVLLRQTAQRNGHGAGRGGRHWGGRHHHRRMQRVRVKLLLMLLMLLVLVLMVMLVFIGVGLSEPVIVNANDRSKGSGRGRGCLWCCTSSRLTRCISWEMNVRGVWVRTTSWLLLQTFEHFLFRQNK